MFYDASPESCVGLENIVELSEIRFCLCDDDFFYSVCLLNAECVLEK